MRFFFSGHNLLMQAKLLKEMEIMNSDSIGPFQGSSNKILLYEVQYHLKHYAQQNCLNKIVFFVIVKLLI
jgi:hypothetical protein